MGWPLVAHAEGPAGAAHSTRVVVVLLLAVGSAYLVTHLLVDRLQRRFLVLSGFEYMALGLALGPAVPAIDVLQDLEGLMPIIALAAGWVGLLRGVELDASRLREAPAHRTRLAVLTHVSAGLLVGAAAFTALDAGLVGAVSRRDAGLVAGFLGCVAASGSIGPLDVIQQRYVISGATSALLRRAARLADVGALFLFGLLFCVFHTSTEGAPIVLRPTEWAVVSVSLGAVLGILFRIFLADDDSENARFLALVGIITFASGAAYLLQLSPLLVNLVLGAVLVNSGRRGARVRETLENTERPMSLVLRLVAGALFPVAALGSALLGGLAAFVLLRLLGKAAGSMLAAWGRPLRGDLYRGLLGHGDVTVAMAISFRLVYGGAAAELAYAIALGAVIISDLVAPRAARNLLVDAGELRREATA